MTASGCKTLDALVLKDDRLILGLVGPQQAPNERNYDYPSSISGFRTEILVHILELAVSTPENAIVCPRARAPFNISQVSRLRREIALDSPNLWAKIYMANPWVISTWMELRDITPLFHAHINRWRSAKFHWLDIKESAISLRFPAPELEVFHAASIAERNSPNLEHEPVSYFNNHTPRLRDLLLNRIYNPLTSSIYTGLLKVHLSSTFFRDIQDIQFIRKLVACPLLEELLWENELVLSVAMDHGGAVSSVASHVDTGARERLPSLVRIHSIDIKHDDPDDGAKCCVVVGTSGSPSELKVLRFEYFIGAPEFIGRALPDLGPRFPLPSLQHLTLSSFAGTKLDAEAFLAMLENLPTITSLELTDCPPSFAYALRVDTGSPIVCPLLKRLWLESDPSPGPQRLVEVMKSRANSNRLDRSAVLENSAPLFHLTLRGPNVFDWELVPDLLQLSIVVDWARSEKKTWR
ncbi:hypothetical protein BOTBODRAFT_70134 [Botryobasidium botryosum FD-172 SS1]|uniref:F-box domain-containing protein n=1 Tax=Botryobasidium botryosum (strain FD-172 SS1) TaxID=930990 RepID=A0A067LX02_BOTB1|nr:hypothetical protein BOTBODRAFT_70134 [Botryobasidium botryosum FD-172 SS1]